MEWWGGVGSTGRPTSATTIVIHSCYIYVDHDLGTIQ